MASILTTRSVVAVTRSACIERLTQFSRDIAVVIGANDVVNPARDNPKSAIAGMPILEVDKGRTVVVLKRGKGKGFAGIENPLFFKPNCGMLYGDAKASLIKLTEAVQHAQRSPGTNRREAVSKAHWEKLHLTCRLLFCILRVRFFPQIRIVRKAAVNSQLDVSPNVQDDVLSKRRAVRFDFIQWFARVR